VYLLRAFKVAISALAANKLRSVLAVLGIVIGVAAVIMVVAMGKGAQARVEATIQKMGANLFFIYPSNVARGGSSSRSFQAETLTVEDAHALASLKNIENVAPEVRRPYQVKYMNKNTSINVVGTVPQAVEMRGFKVERGVFFDRSADLGRLRVCVMGARAALELFGSIDPVGRQIQIDRKNFQVLGVLADKGGDTMGRLDESIYVPISTALYRLFNRRYLSQIMLQVDEQANIEPTMTAADDLMKRLHRITARDEPDFQLWSMNEFRQGMEDAAGAFTMLLSGIAAVSLLVGGIGIMNIMLVSVTERTREIGIRKAIGARRADILRQFLIESMTISFLGGLIGIGVGVSLSQVFHKLPLWAKLSRDGQWQSIVSPESIVLAFFFSCFVGVFFGLYPAMKAAKMNPVEALRYE
jgi:ABC-type antimicrobial peptide transport system permease subunit